MRSNPACRLMKGTEQCLSPFPPTSYLCNMGGPCQSKIARPVDGRIWTWVFNACGSFYGVKFVWPDAESIAAEERAREILYAGLAQVAIGKAMRKD